MVFFVQPPQAQASLQAPLPKERVALGGNVPNPIYMLSFVSNYIQYIFLLYHISKTYVIEKYVALSFCLKPMFFCLTQKPHPVRRPPLCRRGAGGEAIPRKRENQINTLVLKDINFTINIIELSYYRTIDTLNQPKMLPWYCLPKPLQRRGCPYWI